ncbi:hypothetical protein GCM10010218_58200 [Streptomyces mashuensis]|uniref:Uncharacterized protein n=1 Tax=Streptomyces mashuensis TaxID=33904 RepID=A0A919B812_9ACTN|nr:hypothetical protein [Streptomyces mashuensis]GHF69182.1 hypothetical protein GCM10010218_58200 [Streptomyces mashuensis]
MLGAGHCRSAADGEPALHEAGEFGLVQQRDRGVLRRDPAEAVDVADGLVAADAEAAGALAGGDLLGGAEAGPEPVGGAQDVQRLAVTAYGGRVRAGEA